MLNTLEDKTIKTEFFCSSLIITFKTATSVIGEPHIKTPTSLITGLFFPFKNFYYGILKNNQKVRE